MAREPLLSCDVTLPPHLAWYPSPSLVTVPRWAGAEEESKLSSPGTLGGYGGHPHGRHGPVQQQIR